MSYNSNLAYFLSRMSGVSTNYFRLEPQNTTTATSGKIIRFSLPNNALLNMRTLAFHFSASANQIVNKGARLPPKISSLIDRYELSAGGVQIAQGFNGYNVFSHAKDALCGNKCDPVLSHPNMVRTKSYVDGKGNHGGNNVLAGVVNENYNGDQTQFCIDHWEGLLGSLEPSVIDTAILPDLVLTLYLTTDDVLTTSAGVALDGTGEADFTDGGAGGAQFSISNFHLVVETIGLADKVYDEMIERRISQAGFIELPFKSYFSFSDTHTGSTRFTVASQSLDRIWVVVRDQAYSTQGAPLRISGYKKAGAFVDDVAGQAAADIDIGVPDYDIGGILGTNEERYTSKYFNFEEIPSGGNVKPTYQLQLNGAYIPQFKATAEQMYQISTNSIPRMGSCVKADFRTLDQYKNNFFVMCLRLNLPDSEAGRELSGLDTRGIALNAYFNTSGMSNSNNVMIFAECSSTLRIGAGRAVEVVQ